VLAQGFRVDFRHHQRYIRIHAERGGVVDDDGAVTDRRRGKALGLGAARREQRDVDAAEAVFGQLLDGDALALEGKRLTRGARRSEQPQV